MNNHEKKIATKKMILNAAIDEFAEKGLEGARTAEIARRAGVASGLVHYYFESKENLYNEIIKFFCDHSIVDSLNIFPYHKEFNPVEKLHIILYALFTWILSLDTFRFSLFFYRILSQGKEKIHQAMKYYDFFAEHYIIKIIKKGIKEGFFEINSPTLYTFDLHETLTDQILHYNVLRDTEKGKEFYSDIGSFEEELCTYFITTNLKKLAPQRKNISIPVIPEDLKKGLGSILSQCSEKDNFRTWAVAVKITSKIFGDNFEVS